MSRFCTVPSATLSVIALLAALFPPFIPYAAADELQDIQILYRKGDAAKALERLDVLLAGKPRDAQGAKIAQARFLKGLILAEQGKAPEAIKVYVGLTEDYPELPEPYNNLAVLYASQNQLDKAQKALEMAISTHPSYATAHENLGDIYARMASQAYNKALQLDKTNAAAQTKLAMVKELFSNSGKPNRPPAKGETAKLPAPPVAAPPLPEPAKPVPVKPEPVKPEVVKPAVEPKPAPEVKPVVEAPPSAPPKEKPATGKADSEADVLKALQAWARAWSGKNVGAYLAAYDKGFRAPGGESRASWEKSRKERISRPKSIRVSIDEPRVTLDGAGKASVTFRQTYKSNALSSTTTKTLVFVKSGDKWLIQQERVGR
jgi:tetratricopeptide (TPR) repeat protein